jgi:hypothetical protein
MGFVARKLIFLWTGFASANPTNINVERTSCIVSLTPQPPLPTWERGLGGEGQIATHVLQPKII